MTPRSRPDPSRVSAETKRSPRARIRQQLRWLRAVLMISDVIALGAAFAIAFGIRFGVDLPMFRTEVIADGAYYTGLVAIVIPVWLLVFWVSGLYDEHNLLGGTREYALVFNGTSVGMLLVIMATFFAPTFVIARAWLLLAWGLAFLLVAVGRFLLRRGVYRLRRRGWFLRPTLMIGTNEEAVALARQLGQWRTSGLNMLGFVASGQVDGGRLFRNLYVLGQLEDLEDLVERYGVEELVIATTSLTRAQLVDVFRAFATHEDVHLRLSSGLFEVMTTGLRIKELAYTPLIDVRPVRLTGVDRFLKAALDLSIALGVMLLGAPLFLAIALAVRLDSHGPVLHRRRVLGLNGREFDALKFRTMLVDGDAILDRHAGLREELRERGKLERDPRVTRIGRLLRKTSLDELPQVFNVLLGQMSIVGPRMISPAEHERYGRWDMNLLTVKPGISGLWQVSGRSDLSYDDRVRLDMNYIRNWTIWLDIQILIQTIPAVLRGRGAY